MRKAKTDIFNEKQGGFDASRFAGVGAGKIFVFENICVELFAF
jgi:hypothetical protein